MQHIHDYGTGLAADRVHRNDNSSSAVKPNRGHNRPHGKVVSIGRQALAWRRATRNPRVAEVLSLVAQHAGVDPRLLVHNSRCRAEIAAARQLAMYLMNVILSLTYTEIGQAFGRDRTTVRHACGLIEDRREDPRFEAEVDRLERAIGDGRG